MPLFAVSFLQRGRLLRSRGHSGYPEHAHPGRVPSTWTAPMEPWTLGRDTNGRHEWTALQRGRLPGSREHPRWVTVWEPSASLQRRRLPGSRGHATTNPDSPAHWLLQRGRLLWSRGHLGAGGVALLPIVPSTWTAPSEPWTPQDRVRAVEEFVAPSTWTAPSEPWTRSGGGCRRRWPARSFNMDGSYGAVDTPRAGLFSCPDTTLQRGRLLWSRGHCRGGYGRGGHSPTFNGDGSYGAVDTEFELGKR